MIYYYLSLLIKHDEETSCGHSSVVEYRLAKARVAGSNPVVRSRINAPLAQPDRAFDYESKGREFESLRARHFNKWIHTSGRSSAW